MMKLDTEQIVDNTNDKEPASLEYFTLAIAIQY